MRVFAVLLAVHLLRKARAKPIGSIQPVLQVPLEDLTVVHQQAPRRLHGRFLHLTDLHPDPFYKIHSSTEEDDACHRGSGPAGTYGAETSDCDTPFALVNATFKWIEENIQDKIDFIVWTGDSARHDSDEKIPRSEDQVLGTNRWIAEKFAQVFKNSQDEEDPAKELMIPIVSTFGNNDILPHNILLSGPNKWLKTYTDVWRKFIPEEQRHGFERGGWYYVEVIPQRLAVFSLNTLYFFDHNSAVDGCALRSEPGHEHMEWLRIQLQFMRQRGMKAILIGHIPPARTDSKQLWDETCWQKYTLWLQRYRDVVVGGLYGHMNIDHFMLQDTKEIDIVALEGGAAADDFARAMMDEELTSQSANDYLEELRENWSKIPNPAASLKSFNKAEDEESLETVTKKKGRKSKRDKALNKIGGPWGERFQVTNVGPSVVPNYFPTLRVIEYNITGLDDTVAWANTRATSDAVEKMDWLDEDYEDFTYESDASLNDKDDKSISKKKKKKPKKHKKPKNPDLIIPSPPSKSTPPGPAYSPQTLTLLGYTQYFANLTHINNDIVKAKDFEGFEDSDDDIETEGWHEGKHKGKHPKNKIPHPKIFKYEVEYSTFNDSIYKLEDMTVRSYIKLAHRIGQYKPSKGDHIAEDWLDEDGDDFKGFNEVKFEDGYDNDIDDVDNDDVKTEKKKNKKHKKKHHHHQNEKNKVWLSFIKRAFVGTMEDEELRKFEHISQPSLRFPEHRTEVNVVVDVQDGEL